MILQTQQVEHISQRYQLQKLLPGKIERPKMVIFNIFTEKDVMDTE